MSNLDEYKIKLVNEINSYKDLLIQMGFDWPSNENYNNNSIENLEEFYAEINGYIALHNFRAQYYPHTSGR